MKILEKYQIMGEYQLITDNPFETEKDLEQTLDLLLRIPRPFNLTLFSLVNFPKTELTERLIATHLVDKEKPDKALKQWMMTPTYPRDRERLFWYSLMALTSKDFVPRSVIKSLSRSKFLKSHPSFVVLLHRVTNPLKFLIMNIRLTIKGQVSYSAMRRYFRDFKMSKIRITR